MEKEEQAGETGPAKTPWTKHNSSWPQIAHSAGSCGLRFSKLDLLRKGFLPQDAPHFVDIG